MSFITRENPKPACGNQGYLLLLGNTNHCTDVQAQRERGAAPGHKAGRAEPGLEPRLPQDAPQPWGGCAGVQQGQLMPPGEQRGLLGVCASGPSVLGTTDLAGVSSMLEEGEAKAAQRGSEIIVAALLTA